MARVRIPEAVLTAAHERARARASRDWELADRLRDEIEGAGWTIVDRGIDFALSPAAPPDVEEGDRVRYGATAHVPSRLEEPATGFATIVLIATDWPEDIARAVDGIRAHRPDGTSVVIVADAPSDESTAALDELLADPGTAGWLEVVWTIRAARPRRGHPTSGSAGRPRPSWSCSMRAWSRRATS